MLATKLQVNILVQADVTLALSAHALNRMVLLVSNELTQPSLCAVTQNLGYNSLLTFLGVPPFVKRLVPVTTPTSLVEFDKLLCVGRNVDHVCRGWIFTSIPSLRDSGL